MTKALPLVSKVLFLHLVLWAAAVHSAEYAVKDLGSLRGSDSRGNAINNLGQVTGFTGMTDIRLGVYQAFQYSNGQMTALGALGDEGSYGNGINNLGHVVGESALPYQVGGIRAFISMNGTMTGLGTLGGYISRATAINDSGVVTGHSYLTGNADLHAFRFQNGVMQDIGTLGGRFSYGNAINNPGQIAGSSWTVAGDQHAFIYTNGVMADLGTLGGRHSEAFGINDSGDATGWAATENGPSVAFVSRNGSMQAINSSQSTGFDINNVGQVVGDFYQGLELRAFLYANGSFRDLNSIVESGSGWLLQSAKGINDAGQITGYGQFNGETRAFLLTPVPEPDALILLLLGAPVVGLRSLQIRRAKTGGRA
jgi:probable HAF family extracellular repeat protein